MQKINDELVERFLRGGCTKEEAAVVWEYLQQNPEEPYLLQEYEAGDGQTPLPSGYREEMLQAILKKTNRGAGSGVLTENNPIVTGNNPIVTGLPATGEIPAVPDGEAIPELPSIAERSTPIRAFWKWAAACLVLGFGSWYLLHPGKVPGKNRSLALASEPSWTRRYNADHKKLLLQLPDHSTVQLAPGATIHYRKDYGSYDKREVKVEGDAVFDVVKNGQMPFVVYSEGISTTVLGTIFQVTDSMGGSSIRIKLLEGKVKVGLGPLAGKDAPKDYYLSPGQELLFDKESRNVAIREPGRHSGAYASNRVKVVPAKMDSLTSWYMFNNQGLAEVFDQLSAIYNVGIQYSREDLNNKYFIGRLEKKDSLNKIIRDIALLNHLSVTLQNGRYIIAKRKP